MTMMIDKQESRSCKYDPGMVCFYTTACTYPSLIACLQQNLYLAQKEISLLKEKRNQRHSKASLKWRNNSFYYKKKLRYLEAWMKEKKIEIPTIEELFKGSFVNSEPEVTPKEEVKDVGVRDSNSEGTQSPTGDLRSSTNGELSDNKGGQTV